VFSIHPIYKNAYELQPEKRGGGAITTDTGADAGEGPVKKRALTKLGLVINGTILKTATETTIAAAYDECIYGSTYRLSFATSQVRDSRIARFLETLWICEISVYEGDRVRFRSKQ
jgi:hypothetical protein